MKEVKAIINEYKKIDFNQRKAALATVVKVKGSSYRSPGARMLITDDGKWIGSISGGCLEGDALRKARKVMTDKTAITVTYDTREENNHALGIGLGCNGVIDVLIEPVEPGDENNFINLLATKVHTTQPLALATIFNSFTADKLVLSEHGEILKSFIHFASLNDVVTKDLREVFRTKKSETKKYQSDQKEVDVFIEFIQPVISLIIFGGGFDARPLSQLAKSLGWNVQVTDECVAHIAPLFFPEVDKLSLCNRGFINHNFNVTPYTACVLMSHNYEYDRDILKKLINTNTSYIGILGPLKRFEKMKDEFLKEGVSLTKEDTHRIHSPVGLDIGAETPDEIAISIIAEIQSKFANRSGGFLKYRSGPIHQRDGDNDQVFKQVHLSAQELSKTGSDRQ